MKSNILLQQTFLALCQLVVDSLWKFATLLLHLALLNFDLTCSETGEVPTQSPKSLCDLCSSLVRLHSLKDL